MPAGPVSPGGWEGASAPRLLASLLGCCGPCVSSLISPVFASDVTWLLHCASVSHCVSSPLLRRTWVLLDLGPMLVQYKLFLNRFQCWGGRCSYLQQAILRCQQGVQKFNSNLTLPTWRWSRFRKFSTPALPRLQRPAAVPDCYLCLWATLCMSQVATTPPGLWLAC